ncbi:hypothetical protein K1719_039759 [Acacia pycnantha]|nr:hypothetical protein K1719_039759 [Acacia pycnantha]
MYICIDARKKGFKVSAAIHWIGCETKDNWKWFLTLLEEDLGDHVVYGWNFISDQQKGLLPKIEGGNASSTSSVTCAACPEKLHEAMEGQTT